MQANKLFATNVFVVNESIKKRKIERGDDRLKTNRKIIILAVFMGLITVFGLNYYLAEHTETAPAAARQVEQVPVLVAESTIPQHTRITAGMIAVQSLPEDAVHPEALHSADEVVGGISRADIIRGEQVLSSRVHTEEVRASLSYRIPENMRAVSIPVGDVSGVSGFISPGDRVDVLVVYDYFFEGAAPDGGEGEALAEDTRDWVTVYTTIQNMAVLATGGRTLKQDDEEPIVVNTLTLLANPEQAEVLVYASRQGSLHLTLRSPLDNEILELDYYNLENFDTFRER